jgi:hypothetical protein
VYREGVQAVTFECLDADVLRIAAPHWGGAVVGLENVTKVIIIEHEEARIGSVAYRFCLPAP